VSVALTEIAALVHRETGIRITPRQHPFLRAALDRIGAGSDLEAFLRRVEDPGQRRQLVARLVEEVTVKETSYLRDRAQLERIDWRLLLDNARARGADRARVWTAPCATGEEAYSLALLACEAFAPEPAPVTILATDIAAEAILRARRGMYGVRSVRGLDAALRARYFREERAGLVVGEELRGLVTFAQHNLVSDPFPPLGEAPFDLVLCRNVLIYFDGDTIRRVLQSFDRALAPSGSLVLGAADALCATASRLGEPAAPPPPAAPRPRRELRRPLGRLPAPAPAQAREDAATHFERGLEELERENPTAAVASLRRALYLEPEFGLAAFKLGRAHEALGDAQAARRAYEQALRTLAPSERHDPLLGQVDIEDVAAATRARLEALR
jgi:chemotaxis methyl-accepting protein methylase